MSILTRSPVSYQRFLIVDDNGMRWPASFKVISRKNNVLPSEYWTTFKRVIKDERTLKTCFDYFMHVSLEPLLHGQCWTPQTHPYFSTARIMTIWLCLRRCVVALPTELILIILSFVQAET